MSLFSELQRRRVYHVAALYAASAWGLTEALAFVFERLYLPEWTILLVTLAFLLGFPLAIFLAWEFDIGARGVRRTEPTSLKGEVMIGLAVGLLILATGGLLWLLHPWERAADRVTPETGPPLAREILPNSIAVLPFTDMSAGRDQEYFSDGISEELLNTLAQIPELRVISRSSAFAFKGKDVGIPEIAETLSVSHVLEGAVRREGDRVRITAQLIDARSDTHAWSATYNRDLDSIFAVQFEIATAISKALKVRLALGGGEPYDPRARSAANIDAYDEYLLGRELFRQRAGADDVQAALRHFERAVQLDDGFALGHAHVAAATALLGQYGRLTLAEVNRKALRHLNRAHALEPNLAEIHAARSVLASLLDDSESGMEQLRQALALNPSYSEARFWLTSSLNALGRYRESHLELEKLLVHDPLHVLGQNRLVQSYVARSEWAKARALADTLVKQNPKMGYFARAYISYFEGNLTDLLHWMLKHSREAGTVSGEGFLHFAFLAIDERKEARRIESWVMFWDNLRIGRDEEGIRELQRAVDLNPNDKTAICKAAEALFSTGHVDLSLPYFERWLELVPRGRPLRECFNPVVDTIRAAVARQRAGNEAGAEELLRIARQDQTARLDAGHENQERDYAEAMFAMVEHDLARAISFLESSVQKGLRFEVWLSDPPFGDVQNAPRLVALQEELASIVAAEREKALQLICFDNPVPDFWRPLPDTCEGVVPKN